MPSEKRNLLLALPLVLLATAAGVFWLASRAWGAEAGYLVGFAFYWLVWCLAVPRVILGPQTFRTLLTDQRSLFTRSNWTAALVLLVVTIVTLVMYFTVFLAAPLYLILFAIPIAIFNGFCEELLWRGLYVRAFPQQPLLAILVPSIGFALWHLAPQLVFPSTLGVLPFVSSTFFLGLAYAWIAWRTGSAKWSALSHSFNGILALSGLLAPTLLLLLHLLP